MWKRIQVRVFSEDEAVVESVVAALWEFGADGTEIRDRETWCGLVESPFLPPPIGATDVIGYFPPGGQVDVAQLGPDVNWVASEPFDPDAWTDGWRQFFTPTRVSRRLTVRPSWDDRLPPGEHGVVLVIDPGMAFGTGTHATTRLCLQLLDDRLVKSDDSPSVLDVGSGSGILTMAASQLGASRVLGVDIDPEAVRTASENWIANGLPEPPPYETTPIAEVDPGWDVVIANMISGILRRLRDDIVGACTVGGRLLVSGVLIAERDNFADDFAGADLELLESRAEDEWCALLFRRTDAEAGT